MTAFYQLTNFNTDDFTTKWEFVKNDNIQFHNFNIMYSDFSVSKLKLFEIWQWSKAKLLMKYTFSRRKIFGEPWILMCGAPKDSAASCTSVSRLFHRRLNSLLLFLPALSNSFSFKILVDIISFSNIHSSTVSLSELTPQHVFQ